MFNYDDFYKWAREQKNIFISEYQTLDDFECISSKEKNCSFCRDNKSKRTIEKIFVPNGVSSD